MANSFIQESTHLVALHKGKGKNRAIVSVLGRKNSNYPIYLDYIVEYYYCIDVLFHLKMGDSTLFPLKIALRFGVREVVLNGLDAPLFPRNGLFSFLFCNFV